MKILLIFGGLFGAMAAWFGIMWWLGRDADKILEAYRKTYRAPKP